MSRATYANLFGEIGTAFGSGNGVTTFTLPDFRSSVFGDVGQKIINNTFLPANIDTATDLITLPNIDHLFTGTPIVFSTTGTVPVGLVAGTTYFTIKLTSATIKLASTISNAKAGIAVNITTTGIGTHTLTVTLTNRTLGLNVGEEEHLLVVNEMPDHSHVYTRYSSLIAVNISGTATNMWQSTLSQSSTSAGGNITHNIMQPTLFGGSTFIFSGV